MYKHKVFTLEEIYDEYKYGNYKDDCERICHDVAVYIVNIYGLSFRHASMVANEAYKEKKNDVKEFLSSIDIGAKIAIKIRDDIEYRIIEQLKTTFAM